MKELKSIGVNEKGKRLLLSICVIAGAVILLSIACWLILLCVEKGLADYIRKTLLVLSFGIYIFSVVMSKNRTVHKASFLWLAGYTLIFYFPELKDFFAGVIRYLREMDKLKAVWYMAILVAGIFLLSQINIMLKKSRQIFSYTVNIVRQKKQLRYYIICIVGLIAGFVIYQYFFAESQEIHLSGILLISSVVSVTVAVILNENVFEIREHPCVLTLSGLIVISVMFLLKYTGVLDIGILPDDGGLLDYALYMTIMFAIWIMFVFATGKNIATKTIALGIILEIILVAASGIIYTIINLPDYIAEVLSAAAVGVPIVSTVALTALYVYKNRLGDIIKRIFQNKLFWLFFGIMSLWSLLCVVMCIIRWNAFHDNKQQFFDLLCECGAYIAIAFFVIAAISSIGCIIYMLIGVIANKEKGTSRQHAENILSVIFAWISIVSITWITKGGKFLRDAVSGLESMSENYEVSISIIAYIYGTLLIAYVTLLLVKSILGHESFEKCRQYFNNEQMTQALYYYHRALRDGECAAAEKIKDDFGESLMDNIPETITDVAVLNIVILVIEIRDFCFEAIQTVIKPFKPDGIFISVLKDLFSLFIGK